MLTKSVSVFAFCILCPSMVLAVHEPDQPGTLERLEHSHHGDGGYESAIAAELVLEWQNEYRTDSDDTTIDDTNNSFFRAEFAPIIHASKHVFIDGVIVFEPFDQVHPLNANDDIWFDRNGAFIEEIKLNYENGPFAVWGGKFNPGFGAAWDYGRGIWTEDFAEDYEITEKIGLGVSYTLETQKTGNHTVSVTSFFADTSVLSESVITARDRTKLRDGGASNTEDFSSFTLSLDGENLGGVDGLNYHLGFRHMGEEDAAPGAGTDDESGFAANLNYAFDVSDEVGLDVLVEYASIQNFEGVADIDHDYLSVSVVATILEDWNLTGGFTQRDIDAPGSGSDSDDSLFQLSGGYDFGNGLTAEAGWRSTEEANIDTDIIGFLLRYTREF